MSQPRYSGTNNVPVGVTFLEATLDDTNDSISTYPKCSEINIAASTLIKTGAGNIYGIIINSHSSGTIKLWDNTAASGTVICETITLNTGERWIPFWGASFGTGLFVTIGGTANITVMFR